MKISKEGALFIQTREGYKTDAYQDGAGIWTIGYGHTGKEVKKGMVITKQEADSLFLKDIELFEKELESLLEYPVKQYMFDAMLSLMYNIGYGAFKNSSLLRELNKNKGIGTEIIAKYFLLFNKITVRGVKKVSNGLMRRREAESIIFINGDYECKSSCWYPVV